MIDTLKYRSGGPSPMLGAISGVQLEGAPGSEGVTVEEAPAPAASALDEMAAVPGFDPSATVSVGDVAPAEPAVPEHEFEVGPAPEPAPERVDEPQYGFAGSGAAADTVDFEVVEEERHLPPPVQPVTPPPDMWRERTAAADESLRGLSAEDQSKHEEARRFARLLVSEIKLYNEEAVERGREQRDLYQRLRDDIDRSREMYEKRIPADIRAAHDHFREELVRILAGG
jgi:hypothetical protein